jgi:hypothetical protein
VYFYFAATSQSQKTILKLQKRHSLQEQEDPELLQQLVKL